MIGDPEMVQNLQRHANYRHHRAQESLHRRPPPPGHALPSSADHHDSGGTAWSANEQAPPPFLVLNAPYNGLASTLGAQASQLASAAGTAQTEAAGASSEERWSEAAKLYGEAVEAALAHWAKGGGASAAASNPRYQRWALALLHRSAATCLRKARKLTAVVVDSSDQASSSSSSLSAMQELAESRNLFPRFTRALHEQVLVEELLPWYSRRKIRAAVFFDYVCLFSLFFICVCFAVYSLTVVFACFFICVRTNKQTNKQTLNRRWFSWIPSTTMVPRWADYYYYYYYYYYCSCLTLIAFSHHHHLLITVSLRACGRRCWLWTLCFPT
jgi:hypothetical protein